MTIYPNFVTRVLIGLLTIAFSSTVQAVEFGAAIEGSPIPDPPFTSSDVVPLVRGGAIYRMPVTTITGLGMLRDGSNATLPDARTTIVGPNRVRNVVDDFGADNTGATDTTVAIQTAIDSQASIFFPCGTYKVSTTITSSTASANIYGAGPCTFISSTSETNDVLVVSGTGTYVHDLQFTTTVTRTAGSYVKLTGFDQRLYDFTMTFSFIGVYMGGAATIVDRGYIVSTASGVGSSIYINAPSGGSQVIGSGMILLGDLGAQPLAGIHVVEAGDLTLGASEIIRQGTGLLVIPDTGQAVFSLNIQGTFFDNSSVRGIDLCQTGGGAIVRAKFNSVWASSSGSNGIRTCAGVYGADFIGSHIFYNGSDGVHIQGGTNVNFLGGQCAQNTGYCVNVDSGISNWSVIGMQIGAIADSTANTVGGILTAGASDFYSIVHNNFMGQTGNVISDQASGIHKNVHSNPNDPADYSIYRDTASGYLFLSGTQSTSSGFKFLTNDGSLKGTLNNTGDFALTSSTASSSPSTGALVVPGGAGIGGNLNVGGAVNVVGAISDNGTAPTGTAGSGYVRSTAPALSNPSLITGTLTNVPTPSAASDAVPKSYVDSIAAGIVTHEAVIAKSTGNLTATYANGTAGVGATLTNSGALAALVLDGVTINNGDRVLIPLQSTTYQNGVYIQTTAGTGAIAWVLTRDTDFDAASASEVAAGASIIVVAGTTWAATNWIETGQGPFTLGTTPIIFSQLVGASTGGTINSGTAKQLGYYAGTGTTISGLATGNNGLLVTDSDGDPSISSTIPNAAQDLITRLGTIAVGVWNGTIIGVSKGGTGVDLSATGGTAQVLKQASVGGNITVGTLLVSDLTTTATNDNAAAGKPGEFLSASASAISVTTTTQTNITSLALTAGDWDVSGIIKFNPAATTTSTLRAGGLSLTTATLPTTISVSESVARESGAITAGQLGWTSALGTVRVSTAGTPTVYCVGRFTFTTSTATADCVISARRVR